VSVSGSVLVSAVAFAFVATPKSAVVEDDDVVVLGPPTPLLRLWRRRIPPAAISNGVYGEFEFELK